jgi:hypothetical protein
MKNIGNGSFSTNKQRESLEPDDGNVFAGRISCSELKVGKRCATLRVNLNQIFPGTQNPCRFADPAKQNATERYPFADSAKSKW